MFKYKIVKEYSEDILEESVEALVEQGWRLQGGSAMDTDGFHTQAMVKGKLPEQEKEREWKIVWKVCAALLPEVGNRAFEEELTMLMKEGWKPDGDTLSMPVKIGHDPTFILLKPMYREKE